MPPKPRFQILSSLRSRTPLVVSLATIAIVLSIMLPSFLSWWALHNPDWSWSFQSTGSFEYLDEDFILFNRPFINVSEYPPDKRMDIIDFMNHEGLIGRFRLKDNETAVWRDCTVYTGYSTDLAELGYTWKYVNVGHWNPEKGKMDYGNYTSLGLEIADEIVLSGFANLTMINVTVDPQVTIGLRNNASLKMINCTNIDSAWLSTYKCEFAETWPSGAFGEGLSRYPIGCVTVSEDATAYIEGSTIGKLTVHSDNVTVTNSSIQEVRVGSWSPPRFVDSELYELYADEGDVELIGTTEVAYLLPSSHPGRGPDIAYRMSIGVDKKEYLLGEPVNVTIRMENLGFKPITLFFNGSDSFYFRIKWYNESSYTADGKAHSSLGDHTIYKYYPDHSHLPTPRVIEPGEVGKWTLMWRQDPLLPPDHYAITCTFNGTTIDAWFQVGGYPDFTISEETWQG